MSADGSKVVAAADYTIYTSTSSGAHWSISGAPWWAWTAVASSADGNKLVAAGRERLYTSSDAGATWTPVAAGNSTYNWVALASSDDGNHLAAIDFGSDYTGVIGKFGSGQIYTSADAGAHWVVQNSPGGTCYFC